MKRMIAWMLALTIGMGLLAGCKNKSGEPVEPGPDQNAKIPVWDENQRPPDEPQPVEEIAKAPPVDTGAGDKSAQLPKENYAPAEPKKMRTYIVKKNDTLQKISRKFYNTHKKWREIYNANRDVLPDGPDKLQIGMKLKIP